MKRLFQKPTAVAPHGNAVMDFCSEIRQNSLASAGAMGSLATSTTKKCIVAITLAASWFGSFNVLAQSEASIRQNQAPNGQNDSGRHNIGLASSPSSPSSPIGSVSDSQTIVIKSSIVKLIESVDVPAELAGVLSTLKFREGQMVQAGEVLATINSDELALRLKRAEIENRIARSTAENDIDVRFAERSLDVAVSRVERSQRSNNRVPGIVPAARLEEQQLEVHRDRLRVEQADRDRKTASMQVELTTTDVEVSRLLKEKATVRSPIDGMVVSVSAKAGEWVKPGDAIIKIVRLDRLKVEGYLPAKIASQIRVGNRATAVIGQDWLDGHTFPGQVIFINPEANPVNSHVQVWVEIENQGLKLVPGLEATLTIEYSKK
jgi:multidrug efflux pump subunit AcrA (membrane-fusion protein)